MSMRGDLRPPGDPGSDGPVQLRDRLPDWDALDDVFTPDAHIDYSVFGGSVGDLPSTKEFLAEAMPMFPALQHMVSGTTITIDGDTAETKTQCHNPMTMGDADDPDLMVCGLWYVDKLVRTDDGWRIKERVEEKVYMRVFPEAAVTPYTLVSADCHAGASHDTYRGYLEEKYLDDFDAWRAKYKNPFRDLQGSERDRNWNNERRIAELEEDGIVGEVIFPNTVPPFFPSMALLAARRPPTISSSACAGIRAHNRWLADWCAEYPLQRAGIGQIFLNDVDEAIADVRWIKEHDLRGGILIPAVPPDAKHIDPLYSERYDPLWAVCEELGVVVNSHSGSGQPDYGKHLATPFVMLTEIPFFTHRTLVHMLVGGVFERFPGLRFVLTEQGASWIPSTLNQLDGFHKEMTTTGRIGELRFDITNMLPRLPSEYFARTAGSVRASRGPPRSASCRHIALDRFMWGSDYPHKEGTYPYTRESLRRSFSSMPEADLRKIFAGNLAAVYDFDLGKLDAARRERRPDTIGDRGAARSDPGRLGEPGVHTLTCPTPRPTFPPTACWRARRCSSPPPQARASVRPSRSGAWRRARASSSPTSTSAVWPRPRSSSASPASPATSPTRRPSRRCSRPRPTSWARSTCS